MEPIIVIVEPSGIEAVALGFLMDRGMAYVVCSTTDGYLFMADMRDVRIARPNSAWPLGYWAERPQAAVLTP